MAILNKEAPKKSIMGQDGVIQLPAETDIEKTAVEAVAEGAAGAFTSLQQARARRGAGGRLRCTSAAGRRRFDHVLSLR